MKKKILALCLVVVLAVTAVTGATLAYFTDTEKATNVMTAGKVDIDMEEYMVTKDGKVKFESEKALTLYPMTVEQGYAMDANKVVDVYNDSSDAAYIRVIVAFERMDADNGKESQKHHYLALEGDKYAPDIYGVDWENSYYDTYNINGVIYDVHVMNTAGKAAVPAGAKVQSLKKVWLDESVTNEDVKGLGTDGKMNIIVVAQGVQTANFDDYDAAFEATFELTDENIISWLTAADNAVINDHDQH